MYYADPLGMCEKQKKYHETTINDQHDFKLTFDIDNPVSINVMNGDEWLFYNIIISPGDSINIVFADNAWDVTGRGEKQFLFMFDHADKFLRDPVVNKEFNSSNSRLEPIAFAEYHYKRMQDQLNYFDEYFKDTVVAEGFRKAFEYEVQYDYVTWLVQYSWGGKHAGRYLFKMPEYMSYLNKVQLNNINALISDNYVHILRELPYGMWTSNIDRANKNDKINDYYSSNSTRIRDSIAKEYFSEEAYDVALYQILEDKVSSMEYYRGTDHFDSMYHVVWQQVDERKDAFSKDKYYKSILRKLEQTQRSNKPAPDFIAYNADGKEVKLSDFKGKVVYAEFWSTTCAPCVQELPATKRLQERFKDKEDVVFLYISFDSPKERAEKFIKGREFTGTHLFATKGFASDAARKYNISSIPRYIIVDKEGRLVSDDAQRPSNHPDRAIFEALR